MSQAKVDQYKKEKANRKETIAKEKRVKKLTKFCTGVVVAVLAVWIGFSAVDAVKDSRPVETIYCELDELENYINSLYETEEAEAAELEDVTDTESADVSGTTRTMYATDAINVRAEASAESSRLGGLQANDEVTAIGEPDEEGWQKILFEEEEAYVLAEYLSETPEE